MSALRSQALDLAYKDAMREGDYGGAQVVARAEVYLAFLSADACTAPPCGPVSIRFAEEAPK